MWVQKKINKLYFGLIFLYIYFKERMGRLKRILFNKDKMTVSGKVVDVSNLVNIILMNTNSRAGGIRDEWKGKLHKNNKGYGLSKIDGCVKRREIRDYWIQKSL